MRDGPWPKQQGHRYKRLKWLFSAGWQWFRHLVRIPPGRLFREVSQERERLHIYSGLGIPQSELDSVTLKKGLGPLCLSFCTHKVKKKIFFLTTIVLQLIPATYRWRQGPPLDKLPCVSIWEFDTLLMGTSSVCELGTFHFSVQNTTDQVPSLR